ncbi:hypothetical protein [Streptomyces sp. WM6378]|uniref:hypothetical protein n=1 Tax=Streptomyces sp. WM6378 TaxID=1415557 RepID=UPI0006AFA00A|nr:hypothetical protein [Streptomyces sp. WM6378]KOU37623.1 hypothetical protein ADK54_31415 [Streptomyces sp. WM6378]
MRTRTVLFAAVIIAGLALVVAAVRPVPPDPPSPAADNPCQLIAGPARAWCDNSRSSQGEGTR